MPGHGGARSRSGPTPDPNALRRDRADDAAGWLTLPSERSGPAPAWPLPGAVSDEELAHWKKLWTTPQSTVWEKEGVEDDVALYTRSFVAASLPGAAVGLIKEVRMMRDDLGLSPGAALRKRWKIASDTAPAATATSSPRPARATPRGPSSKDRFRIVKAVPDPEEA